MGVTLNYNLDGLTDSILVSSEYTDNSINEFWAQQFSYIYNVFTKGKTDNNPGTITEDDAEDLWTAVNLLKLAAKNGFDTANGQPLLDGQEPTGERAYVTYGMADSLNQLLKSLEAVGFDTQVAPGPTEDRSDIVLSWQDLDDAGLREIITKLGNSVDSNRTLQAMIELEYVKTGNDLIGDNLADLDSALEVTRDALDVLEDAQNLKNKIDSAVRTIQKSDNPDANINDPVNNWTVVDFQDPPVGKAATGGNRYQFAYQNAMEEAFNEPIGVEITITSEDLTKYAQVVNDLTSIRDKLQAQYDKDLSAAQAAGTEEANLPQPPALVQRIDDLLNEMGLTPSDFVTIQDSIARYATNDSGDPVSIGPDDTALNKLLNWVWDNYTDGDLVQSGEYQRTLTATITAAQNLNDSQKEDLRRFMYLFEQFYKSASAVLQAIDRLVNKMAQNIKG